MTDKWINVDPRTKKLSIRFRVRGFSSQFYLSTGLKDSKKNRTIVQSRRDAIETDIGLGQFDSTLERYRFGSRKLAPSPQQTKTKPMNELWELFTEFKATLIEATTIRNSYASVARYIKRFPTQDLSQASDIRDWLTKNTTQFMAYHLLTKLSQCCQWAKDSGMIADNPFDKLQVPKPRRKSTDEDSYLAFTLEQRDIIINAFERHERHAHDAPLIKFLFFSGCRPGEAFALTWGDISPDCCRISITKSRNLYGILKGTKNGKRRIFPAGKNSRLQKLLLEIRPDNAHPSELVFRSKFDRRMTGAILNNIWNQSVSVNNGQLYHHTGVTRGLAESRQIPYYLKPYATRHTFATWAIANGVTVEKVALWIGDEVATVIKYYCHPNVVDAECPDF
ncbi:tyrosine-type recombinase/integrase [Nodularia sphaerocarpa]|uniref:tyrosine-type recombinase/integrase n=1 Tax=Nodularia sphaerocarpa TaxID=137816 RepID=UPI001EFB2DB1|nr:tyrosine-type recombinase/integrase [Nodularia sphaerocarpa]MDB9374681.1 tyrosine-type recombinase/integrase [Nodularia sphaerocarpa CS-585]MDB9378860.1 tyrosine-type recombinase/integrase [Nodularia sphaerocarpa CS-585A2]ULP73090.1 Tyrosine recombinase XerC [Nodularia sphaerocarpa UHCC 0038]